MKVNNLIITSGPSQLLTQITTLKQLNYDLSTFHVVYLGEESKRLEYIIASISKLFNMDFEFSIWNLKMPKPLVFKYERSFLKSLFFNSKRLTEYVEKLFPDIKSFKNSIICLPVRHKMLSDVILIHALRPKKLILTADGVVNSLQHRDFNSLEWFGVKTELNSLPTTSKIYAPTYLKHEVSVIGKYQELSRVLFNDVLSKTSKLTFVEEVKHFFDVNCFSSIIFSQHLALSQLCSVEEEIDFYSILIQDLIQKNEYPVLFKPHPREQVKKIERIKIALNKYQDKVLFLPDEWLTVPIEVIPLNVKNISLVSLNSSALLAISHLNANIICYNSTIFPEAYQNEITQFAANYNAQLITI